MRIFLIKDCFDKSAKDELQAEYKIQPISEWQRELDLPEGMYTYILSGKVVDADYVPIPGDELIFILQPGSSTSSWLGIIAGTILIGLNFTPFGAGWAGYVGGSLIAGALIGEVAKLFTPDVSTSVSNFDNSQTYNWDGIQNIYGEGLPVPVVFGRHRVGGNVIAGFVTGDSESGMQKNKYLHLLLAVSEGEIYGVEEDSILLGSTKISEFDEGVDVFSTSGTGDQTIQPGFSDIRRRYLFSAARLTYDSGYIYTLQDEADSALISIMFPALFNVNDKGDLQNQSVRFTVEYTAAEGTDWVQIADFTCTGKVRSSLEFDYKLKFPSVSRWKLRITRITRELTGSKESGDSYFKSIEEITDAKISYKHTAVLGLKLKATDRISGSVPNVTAIVKGLKLIDVRTGVENPDTYRNPANIVYRILTDKRWGLGRFFDESNLHMDSLCEFADICDTLTTYKVYDPATGAYIEKTEKLFEIDLVLDQPYQAFALLQKILSTCRAVPVPQGNKLKIVVEQAAPYTQLFNMGNIVADSFSQSFTSFNDIPNQIDADYTDSENDYERTKVSIVDTSRLDEATRTKSIQLFGLTTQSRVRRECLYNLRKLKGQRQSVSFEAELAAVVSEVGDVIKVQHDMPGYGSGGRVRLESNKLLFEKPVSVESGKTYRLLVRRRDNTVYTHSFVAQSTGFLAEITISYVDFERDDIYVFGELNREGKLYVISRISKGSVKNTVKISGYEYNESVFTAIDVDVEDIKYSNLGLTDSGVVDEDGAVVKVPVKPVDPASVPVPFVQNIQVIQHGAVVVYAGASTTNVYVSWDMLRVPNLPAAIIARYEILLSDDGENWKKAAETTGTAVTLSGIEFDQQYYAAVKAYSIYGTTNSPETHSAESIAHGFLISVPVPGAVSGLLSAKGLYKIDVRVLFETFPTFKTVDLYMSASNLRETAELIASAESGRFSVAVDGVGAVRYFWARLRDVFDGSGMWYPDSDEGVRGHTETDAALLWAALAEGADPEELRERFNNYPDTDEIERSIAGIFMFEEGMFEDGMFEKRLSDLRPLWPFIYDFTAQTETNFAQIAIGFEGIVSTVAALQDDVVTQYSQITQTIDGITSDVQDLSDAQVLQATQIIQLADSIALRVAQADYDYDMSLLGSALAAIELDIDSISSTVYDSSTGLLSRMVQQENQFNLSVMNLATGKAITGLFVSGNPALNTSEIGLMADKVYIYSPHSGNQKMAMFDTTGGRFGFNGDMIVTGTITADKYAELRNTLVYNGADSLGSGFPFDVPFTIPSEVTSIKSIKLSFKIMPYRAYSKAVMTTDSSTSSNAIATQYITHGHRVYIRDTSTMDGSYLYWVGGKLYCDGGGEVVFSNEQGHSHKIVIEHGNYNGNTGNFVILKDGKLCVWSGASGGSVQTTSTNGHTHTLSIVSDSSMSSNTASNARRVFYRSGELRCTFEGNKYVYTNTVTVQELGDHNHTIYGHTHDIDYGIFEQATAPNITLARDNGSGFTNIGTYSSDQLDLELKTHFSGTGWKALRFSATSNCRISFVLQLKTDLTA